MSTVTSEPTQEQNVKENVKTIDDLIDMNLYTLLVIIFSEFILLAGIGNYSYMIFAGASPKSISCSNANFTIANVCSLSSTQRQSLGCSIDMEYEFKSVNVEFHLICEDTALVKQSISIQMAGVLAGTLLTGFLADRFGRLKILTLSYVATCVLGILSIFSKSLLSFTILRTLQGPFVGGLVGTSSVYLTEHISKRHRFFISTVIGWSLNFILVVLIAIYSKEWRAFQINLMVVSSPTLILFWFVCESPRWLLQRGKLDQAGRILEKAGRHADKREIESLISVEYEKQQCDKKKKKVYTWKHLFHTRRLGATILLLSFGTFIVSITSFALIFNLEKLSGSIYWNALILALIRWIINVFTGMLDFKVKWIGRKAVHFLSQGVTVACIGAITVVYLINFDNDFRGFIRVATIAALAMSTQIYITKDMVALEMFPTVIRNQAISFKSIFSRFGVIVAPQLFLMSSWMVFPYSLLFFFTLIDTLLFQMFITETKGLPLPDRLPEKETKEKQLLKKEDSSV